MKKPIPLDRIRYLDVPDTGLSDSQVESRREQHGRNDIVSQASRDWRELVREMVKDPMLWFLLGTGSLYAFVGETGEAVALLFALVPLLGMDAILHRRTQASTEGLRGQLATRANVVRDGHLVEIPSVDVVCGDILEVRAAESFPADGVVLTGDGLQVDESTLTGESTPVRKQPLTPRVVDPGATVPGESFVLAGTRLLTGTARVCVLFTGPETLYGEIVRQARSCTERTSLQRAIGQLIVILAVVAVVFCVVLAAVRIHQGHGAVDAILSALTLAVAALPEEFPVVFTFFLGVGVFRLARQRALVRRAVAVENIGRVTTICTDKTGTITEGRLKVARVVPAGDASENLLRRFAAMASRFESGDPLDLAILDGVGEIGAERLATFPFTEKRKREIAIIRESAENLIAACKGAPEAVLALTDLDAAARQCWLSRVDALAAIGFKVIACAFAHIDSETWRGEEPVGGFCFLGFVAFEDPVRSSVREAIDACRAAGIHIIMVTGDHPGTAKAVATAIGLRDGAPRVVLADDITRRLQATGASLRDIDVVARAIPSQKYDLVTALRRDGEIVAVTGDGVNDVPALAAADVGIAMGERGSQSARESADIILLDDDFTNIARAVSEGRQLFANLKLSFKYLLMIHLPLVLTAALVPLAGYPLLYLPIHIVWLELVIHPTALLVFQDQPPTRAPVPAVHASRVRFFGPTEWFEILCVGLLVTAMMMFSYDRSLGIGYEVQHARAMALASLAITSGTITAVLSGLRTRIAWAIVTMTGLSAVLLVQIRPLASWLNMKPLHADDWVIVLAIATIAATVPALRKLLALHARV